MLSGEHRGGGASGNARGSSERGRISAYGDYQDTMDNPSSREDISEMYVVTLYTTVKFITSLKVDQPESLYIIISPLLPLPSFLSPKTIAQWMKDSRASLLCSRAGQKLEPTTCTEGERKKSGS